MTDIERKVLELVNEVRNRGCQKPISDILDATVDQLIWTLNLAIEQREAFRQEVEGAPLEFRQEVSDAVSLLVNGRALTAAAQDVVRQVMSRFIIPKPDPLVEAINDVGLQHYNPERDWAAEINAALAKRNGRIVFDD